MIQDMMGAGIEVAPRSNDSAMSARPPVPTYYEELYEADIYPATALLSRSMATTFTPELDILVPMYGKLDLTIQCIYSIYNFTTTPFHLIILNADNPKDDFGLTHEWILKFQKSHPNMTYCHRKTDWKEGNQFFNLGLKYCQTEYVVTCMNSMTVEPFWEKVGLEIMKHDDKVGTVGFKCLFPNGFIESAGIIFNGITPSDFGRDEPGWRHCESKVEMPCAQWAFALHRKKALVGNLPEGVFNGHVGWDDIDNNMCVRSKGWKVVYCGQGVGIHKPRATRGSNSVEAFLANQQNAQIFYKRWGMWDKYLEGNRMDVKDILKPETKQILGNAVMEYQVLNHLIGETNKHLGALSELALKELGVSPEQYVLEMNPATNAWNLKQRKEVENAPNLNDINFVPVEHQIPDNGQKGEVKDTVEEVKA